MHDIWTLSLLCTYCSTPKDAAIKSLTLTGLGFSCVVFLHDWRFLRTHYILLPLWSYCRHTDLLKFLPFVMEYRSSVCI